MVVKTKKLKGFIAVGVFSVLCVISILTGFFMITAEQGRNKIKITRIQSLMLGQSAVDICKELVRNQFDSKEMLSTDSIYNAGFSELTDISQAVENMIMIERPDIPDFTCEVSVTDKTENELSIYNLDKSGMVSDIEVFSTSELLPVAYRVSISCKGAQISEDFILSGIEFTVLERDEESCLVELSTENARIEDISLSE